MYTLVCTQGPSAEPVTVEELKAHLRLNDDTENSQLGEFISSAREHFEEETGRPLGLQSFRLYTTNWHRPIYLMCGNIAAVTVVKYYNPSGVLTTASGYLTDTVSTPGVVWWDGSYPSVSETASPVGYVDFTAGMTVIPSRVKLAVKELAAHFYEQREAFTDAKLDAVPMGFHRVCNRFKTGLRGSWGM